MSILSQSQIELFKNVISSHQKKQLANARESYQALKRQRVAALLKDPLLIQDARLREENKQKIQHIVQDTYEQDILGVEYDQKILRTYQQELSNQIKKPVQIDVQTLYGIQQLQKQKQKQLRRSKMKRQKGRRSRLTLQTQERSPQKWMSEGRGKYNQMREQVLLRQDQQLSLQGAAFSMDSQVLDLYQIIRPLNSEHVLTLHYRFSCRHQSEPNYQTEVMSIYNGQSN